MRTKVRSFIKQYDMIKENSIVLCGLSGGADSVAMVCILNELKQELHFQLACGHFSHGIRPECAEEEKKLAQELCSELKIDFYHEYGDTLSFCRQNKMGVEDGARKLRYDFLSRAAEKLGAEKIATAHNLNDNAETIVLNIVRGSGMRGLSGIPPVRDNIIRPVMCLTRHEIENYLKGRSVVTDESNFSLDYTRNKIRHTVMPSLINLNENALENISKAGLRLREENEFIEKELEEFIITKGKTDENIIAFDISELKKQPKGFLSRIIHRTYEQIGGDMGKISSVHIDAVRDLIYNKLPPKYIVMPSGIRARLKNKKLLIYYKDSEDKIC